MPVTVVVGGQFGSEGKGKVAHYFAAIRAATTAVRVGGPNSGHTAYDHNGNRFVFRHLPTAALLPEVTCILGAGTFIDVDVLLNEIAVCHLPSARLLIDPNATVISEDDKQYEQTAGLRSSVGSTLTGTGGALLRRVGRERTVTLAKDDERLKPYIAPVKAVLRSRLAHDERVIIEGTQGYGLSLLHSADFPFATSRDTTAGTFVAEAGLSPLDVDEIVLVIRAFPIRVAGNSGPLPNEVTWSTVTKESSSPAPLEEFTSVTQVLRRVARFDCRVVRDAVMVNRPTQIVLNHLDYIDASTTTSKVITPPICNFLSNVEAEIDAKIDFLGIDPYSLIAL